MTTREGDMIRELVRFKVGSKLIRLTNPAGHQVMVAGEWVPTHVDELKEIIGRPAWDGLHRAVVEAVNLHRGDADKIKAHFLSVLRRQEYKDMGFIDLSVLN
jgi:hypothetical protein